MFRKAKSYFNSYWVGMNESAVSREWMNKLSWFFACSYIVLGKLKFTMGMHIVKYDCDLLGPGTLKYALSPE